MLIRSAREEDWKFCLEIDLSYDTEIAWQMLETPESQGWGAHFEEIRLPRKQHLQYPQLQEHAMKSWPRRDSFWVAVENREIVGYASVVLELDQHQARIADLAVSPTKRRQGIATALLGRLTEWCMRYPVVQLILQCPLKSQPAIGFALKHHFVYCGYQDSFWPGQEVALFFRQRIRK